MAPGIKHGNVVTHVAGHTAQDIGGFVGGAAGLQDIAQDQRHAKTFADGFRRDAFNYMLFLRLVPLFPFFLINLGAGLTRVPLRTYVAATMLGILPGSFVYCNAGANLARIDSLSGIASPGVLGALALLGAFALVPTLYLRLKARREGG